MLNEPYFKERGGRKMSQSFHALVTGGSRGIGRGIVEDLVAHDYRVTFLYKESHKAANELINELTEKGGVIQAYQCDIRNFEQTKEVIQTIIENEGSIDGLINNSGVTRDGNLFMMTEDKWKDVIDTNLNGLYNVSKSIISHFLRKRSGKIVNISSVAGLVGIPGQTNYCASKSGIIGFTKSLALEVAKYGITVNAVAPGYIQTEMIDQIPEAKRKELLSQIPVGFTGEISDVAHLVRFLLSDQSRYITGQVVAIDGGLTA